MKNLKNIGNIGNIAFAVLLLGYIFFGDNISSWRRERKNRQIVEDEIERLVNDYGLKIQNPIEDFYQCDYDGEIYTKRGSPYNISPSGLDDGDSNLWNAKLGPTCLEHLKLSKTQ